MREVHVLVESLLETEFHFEAQATGPGCPEGAIPATFDRVVRLLWRSESDCAVAVSFACNAGALVPGVESVAPSQRPAPSVQDHADAAALVRAACTKALGYEAPASGPRFADAPAWRLVVAASFPRPTKALAPLKWVPGRSGAAVPRFFAALQPAEADITQAELFKAIDAGGTLASTSAPEVGLGVEWFMLRNEADVLEIRVRVLPAVVPTDSAEELPAEEAIDDAASEAGPIDERQLEELGTYRRSVAALNEEIPGLNARTAAFPVDVERLRALPEKTRIDLMLAILGVLLRRRKNAIQWFAESEAEDWHERERAESDDSPVSSKAAPAKGGIRGFVKKIAGRVDQKDERKNLQKEHAKHAERFYKAMVQQLGFTDARQQMTDLMGVYFKPTDEGGSNQLDLDVVCSALLGGLGGPPPEALANPDVPIVPQAWLVMRELLAISLGATDGAFDARSRSALVELGVRIGVPPRLVALWEAEIGGALFEVLRASEAVEHQKEDRKTGRRSKVILGAVGGGVLLAVTGGLAAPAVGAAVVGIGAATTSAGAAVGLSTTGFIVGTAIGIGGVALTSLGTAGAAVLFGTTGVGLTHWKMSRRYGDLEEFSFEPLISSEASEAVNVAVRVDDPAVASELDAAVAAGGGALLEDTIVPCTGGSSVAVLAGFRLEGRDVEEPRKEDGSGDNPGAEHPAFGAVTYRFGSERDVAQRSVHLAIFVSGWLQDDGCDFAGPWADSASLFFPNSGHLSLKWESEQIGKLSKSFRGTMSRQAASSAAGLWFRTAMGMTVAWPVWVVAGLANLDNAWLVCAERARLAGQCLAHVLADRQTVGQRPVTLVGHSMGARLIFYCLLELYAMGEFNAVDDVILLATPVTTKQKNWRQARAVVSGRLVNCYLGTDWILAFLYRYLEWGIFVAGLRPVCTPGVENVDLAGLGIQGHHDFLGRMPDILARARAGDQSDAL